MPPPAPAELPEMVLLVTESRPKASNTPPPELRDMVLLLRIRAPWLNTPPPPPKGAIALPPLTVVRCRVRLPMLLTARIRKSGAPGSRLIVLPLPAMVMTLLMTGSPVAGRLVLLTVVSVCVLLAGNTRVSAPLPAVQPPVTVLLLAAVMASTSVQFPLTLIVAASAGA